MITLENKHSDDPLDRAIMENGLRIKTVIIDGELDLIALLLTTGKLIKSRLSDYPKLKKADSKQLSTWRLIGGGIGIEWKGLNEDLSLKGFIQSAVMSEMLRYLYSSDEKTVV